MTDIIIYTTKEGSIELNVNLTEDTVWLSLNQMAQLFGRDKSVVSRHIKGIFTDKELNEASTVAKYATVQKEGEKINLRVY